MHIIRSLADAYPSPSSCVTIGNFDGVHIGHQKLIQRTRERARARGLRSVVVTFDPHPLRVLTNRKTPPFITLTEQKLELIAALGVDATLLLTFTREMAALSPAEFVRTFLVEGISMRDLVIGYDYAFGRNRSGDFTVLSALGREMEFTVEQLDPVMHEGTVVSSTRIRDLIQAGMVWEARLLLSRFYRVSGSVVHGRNRGGRLLGFPTANIALTDELFPRRGVYAVWAETEGAFLPAVANIGYNPTFGNDTLSVEVHLLDFDKNIYGRPMHVHFVQFLRDEKKFSGVEELVAQIGKDITLGRRILSSPEAQPPIPPS